MPADSAETACVACEPTKSTELLLSSAPAHISPTSAYYLGAAAGAAAASGTSGSTTAPDSGEEQKLYTYDACFGGHADQAMVYAEVCQPLLDKVLDGYPCTIFAYGATGTGKTYTMQGDLAPSLTGNFAPSAGLIPRVLYRLFDRLEGKEFSVKISYLELYNEELRDLNASSATPPEPKIFDDPSKRGVVVHNIEESHIANAQQGLKVLHRGAARRQVAATDCNEQSSRSHTVFTITVSVTSQGSTSSSSADDHHNNGTSTSVKVGKLSLVDLAGSENVGKSGAGRSDGRAREAGMINQSLLTLGRVINGLVEKSAHIPYRESKLTRLLQDSLGGRTQTCIIATVSPSLAAYEETLSTLDYALRAKSITNRPESNARLTRHALLNHYAAEMERLRLDLAASREKTGVFLSNESWEELHASQERKRIELDAAKRQAETLDMNLRTMSEQFEHSLKLLGVKESDIRTLTDARNDAHAQIQSLQADVKSLKEKLDRRKAQLVSSEEQRQDWKRWASEAIADADGLRAKMERKAQTDSINETSFAHAQQVIASLTSRLDSDLSDMATAHHNYVQSSEDQLGSLVSKLTTQVKMTLQEAGTEVMEMDRHRTSCLQTADELSTVHQSMSELEQKASDELSRIVSASMEKLEHDQRRFSERMQERCSGVVNMFDSYAESVSQQAATVRSETREWQGQRESALAALQEQRKSELARENARLQAQNTHLTTLLDNVQRSQVAFQQSFLSSVSQQLASFSSGQNRLLREGFADTLVDLQSLASDRASHLDESLAQHQAFQERDQGHINQLMSCVNFIDEGAQDAAQRERRAVEHLIEESDEPVVLTSATARNISAELSASSTVSQSARAQLSRANERHIDSLRQSVIATYQAGSTGITSLDDTLRKSATAWVQHQDETEGAAESHQQEQTELLASCSRHVNGISSHLSSSLRLREDQSTGQTPRKRSWPSSSTSTLASGQQQRQKKRQRRDGDVGVAPFTTTASATTPPASPSKHLADISPNKLSQVRPSPAIKVFSDKSQAMNALDAVIDANLLKPDASAAAKQQQHQQAASNRERQASRSPIKSMR